MRTLEGGNSSSNVQCKVTLCKLIEQTTVAVHDIEPQLQIYKQSWGFFSAGTPTVRVQTDHESTVICYTTTSYYFYFPSWCLILNWSNLKGTHGFHLRVRGWGTPLEKLSPGTAAPLHVSDGRVPIQPNEHTVIGPQFTPPTPLFVPFSFFPAAKTQQWRLISMIQSLSPTCFF